MNRQEFSCFIDSKTGMSYAEVCLGLSKVVVTINGPIPSGKMNDVGSLEFDVRFSPFVETSRCVDDWSLLLREAISSSVRLDTYPKLSFEVNVLILEMDECGLAAAIMAASLGLIGLNVEVYDVVSACTLVTKDRECNSTLTIAEMTELAEITLLKWDGRVQLSAGENVVAKGHEGCMLFRKMMEECIKQSMLVGNS